MSSNVYSFNELVALSGKTRRQVDWARMMLGTAIRPQRVGTCYFFSSEDVRLILDRLATTAAKAKKVS